MPKPRHLQWAYSAMLQPNTSLDLGTVNPTFSWRSEAFPYTVPDGHWLGIVDVILSSKGGSENRASYFVVDNVTAAPDNFPIRFGIPFAVPPGTTLTAQLINNEIGGLNPDSFAQWMTAIMTGWLIEAPDDADYQTLEWV